MRVRTLVSGLCGAEEYQGCEGFNALAQNCVPSKLRQYLIRTILVSVQNEIYAASYGSKSYVLEVSEFLCSVGMHNSEWTLKTV